MSACPECAAAAGGPHNVFQAECAGCRARAVARGPHFFASMRAGSPTDEYRKEVATLGLRHRDVLAAQASDAVNRRPKP